MSESAIRTEIKTILNGITGIGKVHDYERFAVDERKFLDFFKDTSSGKIFGWEITRDNIKTEKITQKFKFTHGFVIKGYYGLQDSSASEIFFQAVVDAILIKFIGTNITGTEGFIKPQSPVIQARMFGGVLCHYSEIKFDVIEIVEKISDETVTDLLTIGLNYYLKPGDDTADGTDVATLA